LLSKYTIFFGGVTGEIQPVNDDLEVNFSKNSSTPMECKSVDSIFADFSLKYLNYSITTFPSSILKASVMKKVTSMSLTSKPEGSLRKFCLQNPEFFENNRNTLFLESGPTNFIEQLYSKIDNQYDSTFTESSRYLQS
jgi:hypothetical protein